MKLCILYGGTSSEREVSIASAESIYRSILSDYDIKMYDFNGNYDELYNNIKDKVSKIKSYSMYLIIAQSIMVLINLNMTKI